MKATLTGYKTDDGKTVIMGIVDGDLFAGRDALEGEISIVAMQFRYAADTTEGNRIRLGNLLDIQESAISPDAWEEGFVFPKMPQRSIAGLAAKKRFFELAMKARFGGAFTESESAEYAKLLPVFQIPDQI